MTEAILENEDEFHRVAGKLDDNGKLSIDYQYRHKEEDDWSTWCDEGATLSPAGMNELRVLLGVDAAIELEALARLFDEDACTAVPQAAVGLCLAAGVCRSRAARLRQRR